MSAYYLCEEDDQLTRTLNKGIENPGGDGILSSPGFLGGKMKGYRYILFDLDGTVTDPGEGITNSVMYALKKFGIEESDRRKLYRFIGPPLADSFQEFYGFSVSEAKEGIRFYREYYSEKGILENKLYPGIEDVFKKIRADKGQIIMATSKPEFFARQILEYFHLDRYFDFIAGATMDEKRVKKGDVIAYALEEKGITDRNQVLMIGDRKHDIQGAKENGLDSMGVLYGYGSREELEMAGADYIAESVEELYSFF